MHNPEKKLGDECCLQYPPNYNIGIAMVTAPTFPQISPSSSASYESVQHLDRVNPPLSDVKLVHLNVGGIPYITTTTTLTRHKESNISRFIRSLLNISNTHDENESIDNSYGYVNVSGSLLGNLPSVFIDRDGKRFHYILNYLRDGELHCPDDLLTCQCILVEAKYFNLIDLTKKIERKLSILRGRHHSKTYYAEGPHIAASGSITADCELRSSPIHLQSQKNETLCSQSHTPLQRGFQPDTRCQEDSLLRIYESDDIEESGSFVQTTPVEVLGSAEFSTSVDF